MKGKIFAAVMIGAMSLTSCVKDFESASVTAIRNAKAEELNSIAALNKAKAQTEASQASLYQAQAAYQQAMAKYYEAQAKYHEANAESVSIQNQLDAIRLEQALANAEMELEIAKLNLEAQLANAQNNLLNAQNSLNSTVSNQYTNLIYRYNAAYNNLANAKQVLFNDQQRLRNLKDNLKSDEEYAASQIEFYAGQKAMSESALAAYKKYYENGAPTKDDVQKAYSEYQDAYRAYRKAYDVYFQADTKVSDCRYNDVDALSKLTFENDWWNMYYDSAFAPVLDSLSNDYTESIPVIKWNDKTIMSYLGVDFKVVEYKPVAGVQTVASIAEYKYTPMSINAANLKALIDAIKTSEVITADEAADLVEMLDEVMAAEPVYTAKYKELNEAYVARSQAWLAYKAASDLYSVKYDVYSKLSSDESSYTSNVESYESNIEYYESQIEYYENYSTQNRVNDIAVLEAKIAQDEIQIAAYQQAFDAVKAELEAAMAE